MQKYNHYNRIKKKIIKQYNAHFIKSAAACVRQGQRWGKEKGVTKDCKGTLIKENYKNVQNGHGHSVLWEKRHLRHIYIGRSHDFTHMTKNEN
jgi:hypothetical protein